MAANEVLAVLMFVSFIALVFSGFPVAWLLGGLAVIFSALAIVLQVDFNLPIALDWSYTSFLWSVFGMLWKTGPWWRCPCLFLWVCCWTVRALLINL